MVKAIQALLLMAIVSAGPFVAPEVRAQAAAPAAQPQQGPQEMIQQVSQSLLKELETNREGFRKDPAKLRALVDKHLLPHFDTDYSARLVLGKHWTAATTEQRRRFIDAFIQSMMSSYGDAILDFTSDRLRFLPFKGDPAAKSATVRTEVKRSDGTPVPVNYSLRRTPEGWKAWDVTIEGISYVKNFKTDFGAEIDQKGLDALIQRLESQNAAPKAKA
jgi:phospholipid transport system substrate-binding protein